MASLRTWPSAAGPVRPELSRTVSACGAFAPAGCSCCSVSRTLTHACGAHPDSRVPAGGFRGGCPQVPSLHPPRPAQVPPTWSCQGPARLLGDVPRGVCTRHSVTHHPSPAARVTALSFPPATSVRRPGVRGSRFRIGPLFQVVFIIFLLSFSRWRLKKVVKCPCDKMPQRQEVSQPWRSCEDSPRASTVLNLSRRACTRCHQRPEGEGGDGHSDSGAGLSRRAPDDGALCRGGQEEGASAGALHGVRRGGRGARAPGEELSPWVPSGADPPEHRSHEFKADTFRLRKTDGETERVVRGIGAGTRSARSSWSPRRRKRTELAFENVYR